MSEQSFSGPIHGHNVFAGFSAAGSATININNGGAEAGRQLPPANSTVAINTNGDTNSIHDLRASDQSNIHVGNRNQVYYYNSGPVTYGAPQPHRVQPFSTVPFPPDPDFVDRPDITSWLRNSTARQGNRMALVGLGGVGKSQLAIQYANEVKQSAPGTFVFWVHASSKTRFGVAYRTIADRLQLPGRDNPQVDVLQLVLNWLQDEENGPWLIILDNADDNDVLFSSSKQNEQPLASFLPKIGHGSMVITSRNLSVAQKLVVDFNSIYHVPNMETDQALSLLQNKFGRRDDSHADLTDLVEALGHVPLALSQAAAYLQRRAHIPLRSYLDEFHRSGERKEMLLHQNSGDLRRDESASNSVIATWQITFDQIREGRPSAAALLSLMSLFNPQGIPNFILKSYARHNGLFPEESLEEDLETLCGYSLVSRASNGDLNMHFLVQHCTRMWLSVSQSMPYWKRTFLWVIVDEYPAPEYENWSTCLKLDPHIEGILSKQPAESDERIKWAAGVYNIAVFRHQMASYIISQQLFQSAFEVNKTELGEEHPETLHCLRGLAKALSAQGKYQEAQNLNENTIQAYQRVLGRDHPDTLDTAHNLATDLSYQGRDQEAEQLNQQVLERRELVLGIDHPHTLRTAHNLAINLRLQGKYQQAQQLNKQTLIRRQNILGRHHPDTLITTRSLATDLYYQGNYQESEQLNKQILEQQQRILGRNHPDTLITTGSLAVDLYEQGRYQEAQQLNEQVLEQQQRILGRNHPDTLITTGSLALYLYGQGRYQEAQQLNEQVLEQQQRMLGNDHPDTLKTAGNLALCLYHQGKYQEAQQLKQQVLEQQRRVLGNDHPDTLKTAYNLALGFSRRVQFQKSTQLFQQTLEESYGLVGGHHPNLLPDTSYPAPIGLDLDEETYDSCQSVTYKYKPRGRSTRAHRRR